MSEADKTGDAKAGEAPKTESSPSTKAPAASASPSKAGRAKAQQAKESFRVVGNVAYVSTSGTPKSASHGDIVSDVTDEDALRWLADGTLESLNQADTTDEAEG